MRYVGSKNKLAKDLAPVIQSYIALDTKDYLEPFVGGANMIDKISHENKIGCDIHEELIELLKYAQTNPDKLPERILEEEYKVVKDNKNDYDKWYVGLVGFCASLVQSILVDTLGILKMITVENGHKVQSITLKNKFLIYRILNFTLNHSNNFQKIKLKIM